MWKVISRLTLGYPSLEITNSNWILVSADGTQGSWVKEFPKSDYTSPLFYKRRKQAAVASYVKDHPCEKS